MRLIEPQHEDQQEVREEPQAKAVREESLALMSGALGRAARDSVDDFANDRIAFAKEVLPLVERL